LGSTAFQLSLRSRGQTLKFAGDKIKVTSLTLRFGRIRQTQFIPNASPSEIYRAFVNARVHSDFTGSKATGQGRVGGKFTAWDGYITGKNLRLEKGRRIVQEWRTTEFPEEYPPSKLELVFKAKQGGTQITMTHSKIPASQTKEYRSGWISSYWDPMREYFRLEKRARTSKPK